MNQIYSITMRLMQFFKCFFMDTGLIKYGLRDLLLMDKIKDVNILFKRKLPFLIPRIASQYLSKNKAPMGLQIEPTNYCHLNCICCSTNRSKRKKGYMDLNLFNKIIVEAARNRIKRVHLYLHGEPLLHPKLLLMISLIKEANLSLTLATNGMLFTRQFSHALLETGVDWGDHFMFSILGHTKSTHEKVMAGVNHEIVVQNVMDFYEVRNAKKMNGPIIEVIFHTMLENKDETIDYQKFWNKRVDHVRIVNSISHSFANYKQENQCSFKREKTCRLLWERMPVFWDGSVTICDQDLEGKYIYGTLVNHSIEQLWHNTILTEIKQLHRKKRFQNIEICSECDW